MSNTVRIIPASGSLNFEYTQGATTNNIELKYGTDGVLGFYSGSALLMAVDGTQVDVKSVLTVPVVDSIPSNAPTGSVFFNRTTNAIEYKSNTGVAETIRINNNADNRIITATGNASQINGESNLTFDGTNFEVRGNATISGNVNLTGLTTDNNLPQYLVYNSSTGKVSTRYIANGSSGTAGAAGTSGPSKTSGTSGTSGSSGSAGAAGASRTSNVSGTSGSSGSAGSSGNSGARGASALSGTSGSSG